MEETNQRFLWYPWNSSKPNLVSNAYGFCPRSWSSKRENMLGNLSNYFYHTTDHRNNSVMCDSSNKSSLLHSKTSKFYSNYYKNFSELSKLDNYLNRPSLKLHKNLEMGGKYGCGASPPGSKMVHFLYRKKMEDRYRTTECPPLERIVASSHLRHGVDRLLQTETALRSVEKLRITSLTLPPGLSVCKLFDKSRSTIGVFITREGTQEGSVLEPQIKEVQESDECIPSPSLKTTCIISLFTSPFSWLKYVRRTDSHQQANLKLVRLSEANVSIKTSKKIAQGEELFLHEDDVRNLLLLRWEKGKFTDRTFQKHEEFHEDAEEYEPNGYQCQRCGKVFAYRYYRDKHLKYTRCVDHGDRKYPCHLCSRSFEKRDRLRIHVLHVHEKHRPHQCNLCGKSFSQSSSLNKHIRVHSGERPYECPHCTKAFTASSILRTHIRQHSGEKPFQCRYCGRTFASHAAHDSHVRRTHNNVNNTFTDHREAQYKIP